MLNYTAERLIRLHDKRWSALGTWRQQWEKMARYIMPSNVSGMVADLSPGTTTAAEVYDSTAMEANNRLSNRMHEALTNPATEWFRLAFKDSELEDDDDAREWLDDCQDKLRKEFETSNFNTVMGQFYLDLGAFGTSGVDLSEKEPEYDEDNDKFLGFQMHTLHLHSISIAESANGQIDQVFVKVDYTAEQWVQRFGEHAPRKVRDVVNDEPDRNFPLLVCRFRRTSKQQEKNGKAVPSTRPTGKLFAEEREWAEVWVSYETKEIIDDNGTYERAAFIGRWRTRTKDIMGYGPGERALPTILSLNEAERLEMAAWAKAIDPPIKTTQNNIVGEADLGSAGISVVRDMEKSQTWDLHPDLNHHMIEVGDKRDQIREIFSYHQLELPPREQVGEMTAFEVAKRTEMVYRVLGSTVVQLIPDVLSPLIQRGFNILYRRAEFLPTPDVVLKAGAALEIEYLGPMALAAKSVEIEAIDHFIGDALALKNSEVEEAMDLIDIEEVMRYKAKLRGVPAKVLRSKDQVQAIQDARMQAKEQAAKEQSALNAAQAVKDLGAATGGQPQLAQAAADQQQAGAVSRFVPRVAA